MRALPCATQGFHVRYYTTQRLYSQPDDFDLTSLALSEAFPREISETEAPL